jgi:hypothetical protein
MSNRTPPLWPDPALDDEPPSGSTELPWSGHGSDRHWVAPRTPSNGDGPKRNGHATVIGRLVELALALPTGNDVPRHADVTPDDEMLLRDADERQIGKEGVAIVEGGSAAEWRAFLGAHFKHRYDMDVVFDAASTRLR